LRDLPNLWLKSTSVRGLLILHFAVISRIALSLCAAGVARVCSFIVASGTLLLLL
jgi:hypothetical protein